MHTKRYELSQFFKSEIKPPIVVEKLIKARYILSKTMNLKIDNNLLIEIYRYSCPKILTTMSIEKIMEDFPTEKEIMGKEKDIGDSFDKVAKRLYLDWTIFKNIYEDKDLRKYFLKLLEIENYEKEEEQIMQNAKSLKSEQVIVNAKKYAYLLHFNDSERVGKKQLDKFKDKIFSEEETCGLFWFFQSEKLSKLRRKKLSKIYEILFYYACTHDVEKCGRWN